MNIIEKIVGLVPTVSERAKAIRDFITSTRGKVILSVLLAISVVGYAHHRGVKSQAPKIAVLQKQLDAVNADLKAASDRPAPTKPDNWLADQARANDALNLKVKKYEQDLAKRPRGGDRLTPADVRGLLSIR